MVSTVMADWSLLERRPLFDIAEFKSRKKDRVHAFIQARLGSMRLPGKIYEIINGAPLLYHTINMAKKAELIDEVFVISPQKLQDIPEGIRDFVYAGFEADVLSRYVAALKAFPCDYVVRITADCPILDYHLIDYVIANSIGYDYGSNVLMQSFPDGMDVEVISARTLDYLDRHAKSDADREHVTTLIRNSPAVQIELNLVSIQAFQDQSYVKLSVDTQDDLHRIRELERVLK